MNPGPTNCLHRATHLPRRIAAMVLLGTLATFVAFFWAVWSIRGSSDDRAEADSLRLVVSGLAVLQDELSGIANDYAHWDDAHFAMHSGDRRWIHNNWVESVQNGELFDGLVFFGGPFERPEAWLAAEPRDEPADSFLTDEVMARVEREVARQELGAYETFDMVTLLDGRLLLLSATRIQPYEPVLLQALDPAALPVAVLTRVIDDGILAEMERRMHLTELRFTPDAPDARPSLAVTGPGGEVLGHLSWVAPRPGTEVVSAMAPAMVAAGVIFLLLGAGAAWLASHLVTAESAAQYIALHDPLTGLPNRRCFHQEVERTLSLTQQGTGSPPLTVLMIDLDRFKPVNDLWGHDAGDRLLREVATRLREACPPDSLVVRLGGDEFVVALWDRDAETSGTAVARDVLRALGRPFDFGDWSVRVTCAVGVAAWAEGVSSPDLLRRADQAMYRAKQGGGNGFAHYDDELGRALRERAALEADLRKAIDQGAITPYFQPIRDVQTGELRGFEVLSRWIDPVRGAVPPDVFITLAESIGLISRLSAQVFDRACSALKSWPTDLPFSFNLSPLQLTDRDLPRRILKALDRHGLPGSRLEIEITEHAVLADMELANQIIRELAAGGVRISLDDFGTGTSSIAMLMQLPIDSLKIDRGFIAEVDRKPDRSKIVSGVLSLAESLGLQVTAEGVERPEELAFLRERRCDLAQGYLLGRPQPPEAIGALLNRTAVPVLAFPRSASA